MSKENRFEGLMGAVGKNKNVQTSKRSNVQTSSSQLTSSQSKENKTSKRLDAQTSKAKSANPDYTRTTIYLPKKMHKKLKAIAVEEEREMSEIVEELLQTWIDSLNESPS